MSVRCWASTLVLLATTSVAQTLPRLVVTGFKGTAATADAVDTLNRLLVSDLAEATKWNVVSSSELTTLLGIERQKQLTGCDEDTCRVELAQALGAEFLMDGSVGALGNLRVLTLTLFDAKKAVVVRRETLEAKDEGALGEGVHELAARFTGVSRPRAGIRKGWFVLGGGAVLAVAGVAFGLVALNQYNQYQTHPTDPSLHSSAQTFGYVADGLYGAAIAAGLIAAAMLIFGGDPSP